MSAQYMVYESRAAADGASPRCAQATLGAKMAGAKDSGDDMLAPRVVTPDATPRDRFPLAVEEAYEVMFSAEERKWYSLIDFRGDLIGVFEMRAADPRFELSAHDAELFMRRMG